MDRIYESQVSESDYGMSAFVSYVILCTCMSCMVRVHNMMWLGLNMESMRKENDVNQIVDNA